MPGLLSVLMFAGVAAAQEPTPEPTEIGALHARVAPAVVRVHTRSGNGTAFLIGPTTLATSWHVVTDRTELFVETLDGQLLPTTLLGRDRKNDVALLSLEEPLTVEGEPVTPLPLDDRPLAIGTRVFAVGHPLAGPRPSKEPLSKGLLTWSITDGIVSQIGERAIQITALVQPGNSGGPLLDAEGRVLGVVGFTVGGFGGATLIEALDALRVDDPPKPVGPVVDGAMMLGLSTAYEPGRRSVAGTHLGIYAGAELVFDRKLVVGLGVQADYLASKQARLEGARSQRFLVRATFGPRLELPFRPKKWLPVAVTPYALVGAGHQRFGSVQESLQFSDPACDPSVESCAYDKTVDTSWQPRNWMPMVGGGVRLDLGTSYLDVGVGVNPLNPVVDTRVLLQFGIRFGPPRR